MNALEYGNIVLRTLYCVPLAAPHAPIMSPNGRNGVKTAMATAAAADLA